MCPPQVGSFEADNTFRFYVGVIKFMWGSRVPPSISACIMSRPVSVVVQKYPGLSVRPICRASTIPPYLEIALFMLALVKSNVSRVGNWAFRAQK